MMRRMFPEKQWFFLVQNIQLAAQNFHPVMSHHDVLAAFIAIVAARIALMRMKI